MCAEKTVRCDKAQAHVCERHRCSLTWQGYIHINITRSEQAELKVSCGWSPPQTARWKYRSEDRINLTSKWEFCMCFRHEIKIHTSLAKRWSTAVRSYFPIFGTNGVSERTERESVVVRPILGQRTVKGNDSQCPKECFFSFYLNRTMAHCEQALSHLIEWIEWMAMHREQIICLFS